MVRWAQIYFTDFDCFRCVLFIFWAISEVLLIALVPIAGIVCVAAAWCYGLWCFTVPFRYETKGVFWWTWRGLAGLLDLVVSTFFSLIGVECKCELPTPDMAKLEKRQYRVRIEPHAGV